MIQKLKSMKKLVFVLTALLLSTAFFNRVSDAATPEAFRKGWLRGEMMTVPAPGVADGTSLELDFRSQDREMPLSATLPVKNGEVDFSTWQLAPGRYELTVRNGEKVLLQSPIAVIEKVRGEFPFLSLYALEAHPALFDPYLDYLSALGVDNVYNHITPWTAPGAWDTFFYHDISMTPVLNAQIFAIRADDDLTHQLPRDQYHNDRAQILSPSGALGQYTGSAVSDPYNPDVRRIVKKYIARIAGYAAEQPGLQGIAFDDEYGLAFDLHKGLADYSADAIRRFQELTGLPAPPAGFHPPGIIDDSDPYARWIETIGSPGESFGCSAAIEEYEKIAAGAVHSIAPDLRAYTYPGIAHYGMDASVAELVSWSYRQPDLLAWLYTDQMRADAWRKNLPVEQMLGYYAPNTAKAANPPWLTQQILAAGRLALARGTSSLCIFFHGSPPADIRHNPVMEKAIRQLGQTQRQYGRFLRALTKMPMPVGILSSGFNSSYQYALDYSKIAELTKNKSYVPEMEQPWSHAQTLEVGFPAAIKAGLPAEGITDITLANDDLSRYQAIVLLNVEYMRHSVVERLNDYIRRGGLVFVDKSSAVRPAGATVLNGDFLAWHRLITQGQRFNAVGTMDPQLIAKGYSNQRHVTDALAAVFAQQVQPHLKPALVETHSRDIVATVSESGSGRYIFLINTHLTAACQAQVVVHLPVNAAYDVFGGHAVDIKTNQPFNVSLPPGGWKLLAILPSKADHANINVTTRNEGTLRFLSINGRLLDANNRTINAAIPVAVELMTPEGHPSKYSFFDVARSGRISRDIVIAANEPQGKWTVRLKNLMSGIVTEKSLF